MKKYKVILFGILLCIVGCILFQNESQAKTNSLQNQLANLDISKHDSLMIVAHPDDETIWGGNHLEKGNYLVVCLTNQSNQKRAKEFMQVIKATNNVGVILDYPDKTKGKRDDWRKVKKDIQKDVQTLLLQKQWKKIVTHNPDGEYGHEHHKMTSRIVSKEVSHQKQTKKLYYFNHYVSKKQMQDGQKQKYLQTKLSKTQIKKKEALTSIYTSQVKVMNKLAHMFPYEHFIAYDEWNAS